MKIDRNDKDWSITLSDGEFTTLINSLRDGMEVKLEILGKISKHEEKFLNDLADLVEACQYTFH